MSTLAGSRHGRRSRLGLCAVLVLAAATARPGHAQNALVLGGGGSRGLAHAGVVLGLEQLGYDADVVVGTSMGAIVGALYAAGYQPEAIWREVEAIDWQKIFMPRALIVGPRRQIRHSPLTYAIQARGVGSGGGVVADWRINRLLTRLLFDAGARARGDFDRLPRRFRAVAADLDTGEEVVLGEGNLAEAVRASMAVPGVFAPVAWEGRVLVDGGIANNLPVSVARALGADYVLAVNPISPGPLEAADRPFDVGLRGLRLLINNAAPDTARPDALLALDLDEIAAFTFPSDPEPLLRAGLAASLATFGPTAGTWREAGSLPPARSLSPPPDSFGALAIEAVAPGLAALARVAFADVAPGRYAPEAVLEAVDRLYATGLFDGVWPAVEDPTGAAVARGDAGAEPPDDTPDETRAPTLRVRLVAAPAVAARAAVGYDNDRGARGWGAVTLRTARAAPLELTLAASAQDLERWGTASVRRHSLRWLELVWSAGGYYREADARRFVGDALAGETEVRRLGGWLGLEGARAGAERLAVAVVRAEHVDVEGGESGLSVGPLLRLAAAEPPTEPVGVPAMAVGELRIGAVSYARARARGSLARGLGRLRVAAIGDLAVAGAGTPPDALPALGDAHAVPGLRWGQERGRLRLVAGADIAYPIPLDGWARLRLRAGAAADRVEGLSHGETWVSGAELGVLWTTPLGPILAAIGGNTRGDWRFDLSVGPSF